MQYRTFNDLSISRLGIGTKRMATSEATRVVRLDHEEATKLFDAAASLDINLIDTSYSNHKGEAESFIGSYCAQHPENRFYLATSFFELVDPRYDYVLQKQLKKLETDRIDFYRVEGVSDLTKNRDIDSGAVDYLFEQKEAGKISYLGFSSELNADNLDGYLNAYPWDFVQLRVNWFDWFMRGGKEAYLCAVEHGIPIFGHASLRTGNAAIKQETIGILKDFDPKRSSVAWSLLFAKSLESVVSTTCNMHSVRELKENAALFDTDETLSSDELDVLEKAAHAQQTKRP